MRSKRRIRANGNNGLNNLLLDSFIQAPDDMIGKIVHFKEPECPAEHGLFEVAHVQKVWGYNDKGQYVPGIKGYRLFPLNNINDTFGRPAAHYDIEVFEMNKPK